MEKNLLRYIWIHTRGLQAWIFAVILVPMPIYFYSLDLPKQIINLPIQGKGLDGPSGTHLFLRVILPFSESLMGEPVVLFSGFDLERLPLLLVLCFVYTAELPDEKSDLAIDMGAANRSPPRADELMRVVTRRAQLP